MKEALKNQNSRELSSSGGTPNEERRIVRVEANIEEMPIFSATKRSRKEEVVTWSRTGRDPQTGLPIEQEMIIRPAAGLGLPGKVERDLYYLVICPWIEEHGFSPSGTIGPISYQDAITRLRWTRTGPNYSKIREALKTLVSLNFEFKNCIINGENRQLEAYIYGHMFERVEGFEEKANNTNRVKRGEFLIMAGDWYVNNHRHNYLKPLDIGVYQALDSPVAQSLYQYLDKRAYSARWKRYHPEVEEDILELKERFRLGMSRNADILRLFRRAHKELMGQWPILKRAEIKKMRPGCYKCIYTFDIQLDLPLTMPKQPLKEPKQPKRSPDKGKVEIIPVLARELIDRGMTSDVAKKIIKKFSEDQISRQLDIHGWEIDRGIEMTNPGGRLRTRITEDWAEPKGYTTPDQRRKVEEKATEATRQEAEEEDRRINWWKHQTPEEKARLDVKGPWLARWKSQYGWNKEPSEAEVEEAQQEALKRFKKEAEIHS